MTPSDSDITCVKGYGTLIDFAYVSGQMHHMIKSVVTYDGGNVYPHLGVMYTLDAYPRLIRTRQLIKPGSIAPTGLDNKGSPQWITQWEWPRCVELARKHIGTWKRPNIDIIENYVVDFERKNLQDESSNDYILWSLAYEIQCNSRQIKNH